MERVKKIFTSNKKIIVFSFFAILMNVAMFCDLARRFAYDSSLLVWILLVLAFFVINGFAIFGLVIVDKKNLPLEKTYLIFGLSFGIMMALAMPMGRVPDEPAHFWRAYSLSELSFIPKTTEDNAGGHYLPDNIQTIVSNTYDENGYSALLEDMNDSLSNEYILQKIPAYRYFVLNYIPQVVGIWVGRLFRLPIIPITYVARIFNVVFCTLLIYLCIKHIPILKKFIFLLAFTPMTIQQFASVSADGSIICGAVLLFTYTICQIYDATQKITWRGLLLVLACCLMICITKPVYAPLCCILFFIPKERFGSNKNKLLSIFMIGFISVLVLLLVLLTSPSSNADYIENIDPALQAKYILESPLRYAKVLYFSVAPYIMHYITTGIGLSLEWFTVRLSDINILIYALFFILLTIQESSTCSIKLKIFSACTFVFIGVLIFTGLYLTWSSVGATEISGVQGRYFLPIACLIPLTFLPAGEYRLKKDKMLINNMILYALPFFTMAQAIMTIICSHV